MSDLTKQKPKPLNPLLIFFLPVLETIMLVAWWLYALTTVVTFPGEHDYGHGDTNNSNVMLFNAVLLTIVIASWIGASAYWNWRKSNRR